MSLFTVSETIRTSVGTGGIRSILTKEENNIIKLLRFFVSVNSLFIFLRGKICPMGFSPWAR